MNRSVKGVVLDWAGTTVDHGSLGTGCDFATPIDGVLETVDALRRRWIGIGSTMGCSRQALDALESAAAERGFRPDCAVAAEEVGTGRPAPFLAWEAARRLGLWPVQTLVKVGDTVIDVEAGRNAGMWSVGVALTGNLVGRTAADFAALPSAERVALEASARMALRSAGAHYVIDRLSDLPAVIDAINARLANGEQP